MNKIQELKEFGQSIWLDFISRNLLVSGELKELIDLGVTGVTSNPSIFQKAICETDDYVKIIKSITSDQAGIKVEDLYEKMAVEDIRRASDALLPVYISTEGSDGYVSFEVSPNLADQTSETVSEAQRLWRLVDRPNLMIKVPATKEGIPAIEILTAQGINVNATLIFSTQQYEAAAFAYVRGLADNPDPHAVASVASFFVSRIDTEIDRALERCGSPKALELRGKLAVSCAKLVYRRLNEIFYSTPFSKQRDRGARVQRLVWGSTGTKNPAYSDVLYVDNIIGPDTTNTVPMPTLKAFLDHGEPKLSLRENLEDAENAVLALKEYDIDLASVTKKLQEDGVQAFVQAYKQLLDSLNGKC